MEEQNAEHTVILSDELSLRMYDMNILYANLLFLELNIFFAFLHLKFAFGHQNWTSQKWHLEVSRTFS